MQKDVTWNESLVNGLYVRACGNGPAVLCLAGIACPFTLFETLAKALAPTHRVLVPDAPGYGGSPWTEPYSLSAIQTQIEDMLATRGVSEVDIVGVSFGAYRALSMALKNRVHVRRIVSLGGFADLTHSHREQLARLGAAVRAGLDLTTVVAETFFSAAYCDSHPGKVREVRRWAGLVRPDRAATELEETAKLPPLMAQLKELRSGLLLRVGTADVSTPVTYSEQIATLVPQARLEQVDGAGHILLIEDERMTIQSISKFLGI